MWETIVHHLEQSYSAIYPRQINPFSQKVQKTSKISPEMSEVDVLMEELTGLEDLCEEEKVKENEEKQVN